MSIPAMPANTCPKIDTVLDELKHAREAQDELEKVSFRDIEELIEQIRDANFDLRENAEYFRDLCDEKDEELSKLTDERDALLERVKELEADIVAKESAPAA